MKNGLRQAREDKSWRVGWIKALVEVQKSYKVEELRGKKKSYNCILRHKREEWGASSKAFGWSLDQKEKKVGKTKNEILMNW